MGKLARLRLQGSHKKNVRKEEGVTSRELAALFGESFSKESRSGARKCTILRCRVNPRKRKRNSRAKGHNGTPR